MYTNKKEYTIEKGCPWYEMQQTFGPANVNWCEPTQCSIINEPANTWSNLGYMVPALILWTFFQKKYVNRWVRFYIPAVFFMGLFSFIYHATNNLATQYLDFFGMYLYTGTIITLGIERVTQKLQGWKTFGIIFVLNNALFFLYVYLDWSYQKLVMFNIVVMLILEVMVYLKKLEPQTKYGYFFVTVIFFAVAQTFSLLDHTRQWCEPENLILHGHALWHMFGGVGATFGFIYYKQFDRA